MASTHLPSFATSLAPSHAKCAENGKKWEIKDGVENREAEEGN